MRVAMTTVEEGLQTLADVPVGRPRVWPRFVVAFMLGLLACVGLAAGGLYAWDAGYEGRVLPGVRVGDVDLGGLDRQGAVAALSAAYEAIGEGRVVVRTRAGEVSVGYDEFGRRADAEAMADAALALGRSGTTLERTVNQVRMALQGGRPLEPSLTLDEAALAARIEGALKLLERDPVDAEIAAEPTGIVTTPGRPGRTFEADGALDAALATAWRLDAPAEIVVEAVTVDIPPERTDAHVLAAKAAADRVVADIVVTAGKKHWTIKAAKVRAALDFEIDPDGTIRPVVDDSAFSRTLKKVAKAVRKKAESAQYLRTKSGKVFGVAPGADGERLDRAATTAAIAGLLAERASGTYATNEVPAEIETYQPKLTTAQATKKAPLMHRLGWWRTWFPVSERNYFGANIWLPAQIINGTVLRPGQRFEWWSALGPVTTARGFGPGGFIAGDHTEPTGALGGGMCSSSTTLFNAALRAGLRMGARSNHRYYINRYPLGLDATVSKTRSGGGQTMSFTNDMDHPILIRGLRVISGGRAWVQYEIWGTPDGRTVSLSRPSVRNVRRATTNIVYVSTLPRGVREQTEYPSNGMDTSVTRVVRDRHGRVIHHDTYGSHYTLWNGRIEVGR